MTNELERVPKRKADQMSDSLPVEVPGKKKRNRKAVSCINCRRKKVKCDRTFPCSSCKVRGETCEWAENTKPVAESELGVHDLACEIGRLHRIVKDLSERLSLDQDEIKAMLAPSLSVVATLCPPSRRMSRVSNSPSNASENSSSRSSHSHCSEADECLSSAEEDDAKSFATPNTRHTQAGQPSPRSKTLSSALPYLPNKQQSKRCSKHTSYTNLPILPVSPLKLS
ncbi:hypothetical protein BT69DRAFT_152683 [Atractiella rhizophila]|nr:hypothetical protein BT69DRAFT_152683 [Atractiella rhizophila]